MLIIYLLLCLEYLVSPVDLLYLCYPGNNVITILMRKYKECTITVFNLKSSLKSSLVTDMVPCLLEVPDLPELHLGLMIPIDTIR